MQRLFSAVDLKLCAVFGLVLGNSAADTGDLVFFVHADPDVDLGYLVFQLPAKPLGETTGNDNGFALACFLLFHRFVDDFQRFGNRFFNKRAGINDDDVRVVDIPTDESAGFGYLAENLLGIDKSFRTAKADKGNGRLVRIQFEFCSVLSGVMEEWRDGNSL